MLSTNISQLTKMHIIKNQLIQIKGTELFNDTSIVVIPRQTTGTPGILLSHDIPNISVTVEISCSFDYDCKPFVWVARATTHNQEMLEHYMLTNGNNTIKLPKYQSTTALRVGIFLNQPKLSNRLIIKNIEINMNGSFNRQRKEYYLNDSSDLSDLLTQKGGFSYQQYFEYKKQQKAQRIDYDITDLEIEQLKRQLMA